MYALSDFLIMVFVMVRKTLKIKGFWLSPFFFDRKEEQSHNNQRTGSKPAGGGYGGTLCKPLPVALTHNERSSS